MPNAPTIANSVTVNANSGTTTKFLIDFARYAGEFTTFTVEDTNPNVADRYGYGNCTATDKTVGTAPPYTVLLSAVATPHTSGARPAFSQVTVTAFTEIDGTTEAEVVDGVNVRYLLAQAPVFDTGRYDDKQQLYYGTSVDHSLFLPGTGVWNYVSGTCKSKDHTWSYQYAAQVAGLGMVRVVLRNTDPRPVAEPATPGTPADLPPRPRTPDPVLPPMLDVTLLAEGGLSMPVPPLVVVLTETAAVI